MFSTFTFIPFIHSGDLNSASPRDYYSEVLPVQSRTKKKDIPPLVTLKMHHKWVLGQNGSGQNVTDKMVRIES